MRVVVVHDYATQRGGAERVAIDLLRAFPGSRLVTSCYDPERTFPELADHQVETLWPNRVGLLRRDPRRALPFLASALGRHEVRDADVVVCSSSGWAHRVRSTAPKVIYCHNPARWLYQPDDYFSALPTATRRVVSRSMLGLRTTDAAAARSAAAYVANSRAVADRIQQAYGIRATIVHPPRGISPEGRQAAVPGLAPGFLLTVGRARGYKNTDVVRRAIAQMPHERLVVVGGDTARDLSPGVTALGRVSDEQLRWLYANAAGLLAMSREDFGLTPVEAQAFGLPTLALRAGGYLDSTIEGLTGLFVDEAAAEQVVAGITELRARRWDSDAIRNHGERFSPASFAANMRSVVDAVVDGPVPC